MILGLTGGIASGKSLVATMFRECGIPVIDTDELARQVVAIGQPAWQAIRETFGPAYFTSDGRLDRAALAQRVFSDAEARRQLEAMTHPAIFAEVEQQLAALHRRPAPPPLVVVVVPLLFEVGAAGRFDTVVVVMATPEQQMERMLRQRGYTPAEAAARLAAQLPMAEKVRRAPEQIDNTGTPAQTRAQVEALLHRLLQKSEW